MSFPALKEAQGKLDAKRKEALDIFNEAGPDMDLTKVKSVSGAYTAMDVAAHIRTLNDEMGELQKEVDTLSSVQKAADRVHQNPEQGVKGAESGDLNGQRRVKSIGEQFTESDTYNALFKDEGYGRKSRNNTFISPESELLIPTGAIGLKTLLTTSAGWAPQAVRTDVVVENAQRPVQITDLIPTVETTQNAVVYMEETTFTNAAVETAEAGTYAESALAWTQRTVNVRKIATFLPVTDEQLEDIPQIRGILDQRLPFMVQQRLDAQIMAGDGLGQNLTGLTSVAGISTQPKAADSAPDAVLKAIVKVRVTGRATPSDVLFHSTDWQNVRLLKDSTGNYIWGSPAQVGPLQIWGLPVTQTETGAVGTAVVADFPRYTALYIRRGLNTQVSNSHSTFFVEGKQAIRADMRCAFVVYRPSAICTVTGL